MTADLPPVPKESITAGALVLADVEGDDQTHRDLADDVLRAGAPAIRANERARIRSLLPYNVNCCDGFGAAVADLIGEHGEHHPGPPEVIPVRPKVSRRGPREARDG